MKQVASEASSTITLNIADLGPSGVYNNMFFVAVIPGHPRSDHERLTDQTSRQFKIQALLSRSPLNAHSLSADMNQNDGDSYLSLPDGAVLQKVETTFGTFHVKGNERKELSQIEFECTAATALEARRQFLDTALPFLDHVSFQSNIPIGISQIRIEDTQNVVFAIGYVVPHSNIILGSERQDIFRELKPIYATYREAKNSSSDLYRFLNYYKIIEGIFGKLRPDVYKRAKEEGKSLPGIKDVVPDSPHIAEAYKGHVGTSIKKFFDDVLTPQFRNALAHFSTDDGGILDMSDATEIARYQEIMLACELCTRTVVANHETLLAHLR